MPPLRFVHVSDIHFGQENRNGSIHVYGDVREELIRSCRKMASLIGQANGIIATGDIAFSGKTEEYGSASDWLERLSQAVGCERISVLVVPGNHDIDRQLITYTSAIVQERLRKCALSSLDSELDSIGKEELSNPLLPKLGAYRAFAEQYGCDFISAHHTRWEKTHAITLHHQLIFAGLNSVQVSDKEDGLDKMVLGSSQYILPRCPNAEYVALLHHPMEWYRDRSEGKKYLRRARVLLFGHQHELEIRKITELDEERLELYAGAINPGSENGSAFEYRYNWIEFDLKPHDGVTRLAVTIYPMIWNMDRTEFAPDESRLRGKKHETFELACPNFSHIAESTSISGKEETCIEEKECSMPTILPDDAESAQFARLRYFFWRFLNWKERIRVLAELNIFPSGLNQPIPQTMERLALDSARSQGKLHDLWAAVMLFVPEEKREPNPF